MLMLTLLQGTRLLVILVLNNYPSSGTTIVYLHSYVEGDLLNLLNLLHFWPTKTVTHSVVSYIFYDPCGRSGIMRSTYVPNLNKIDQSATKLLMIIGRFFVHF